MPPESLDVSLARQLLEVEQICDEFEQAWRAGAPPRLEDLVRTAPEHLRPRLFEALLLLECDYRLQQGQPVSPDEASHRFAALGGWAVEVITREGLAGAAPLTLTVPGRNPVVLRPGQRAVVGREPAVPPDAAGDPLSFVMVPVLGDPKVSRLHFQLSYHPPAIQARDLGSRHGTFLNGVRITSADVRDGDVLRAAGTEFRVAVAGHRAEGQTALFGETTLVRPPSDPPLRVGAAFPAIPGFSLEKKLGEGGMGVVYRAARLDNGQPVAIKTLRPHTTFDPDTVRRFQREIRILKELDHPGIVPILGDGEADGLLYLVMEYVEGRNAADVVKDEGPLAPARVAALLGQVLVALESTHAKKIIHRDIKPANILVSVRDGQEVARLADFGLARVCDETGLSSLTSTNSLGGSLGFLPPEQLTNFRNAREPADLYAVGATAYYLLTGQHVHDDAPTTDVFYRNIKTRDARPLRRPPSGPALPPGWLPIFERSLVREPSSRYPDARAMREALARLA